jgi:hypothetical protein
VVTTEIEDAARAAITPPPSEDMQAQMAASIREGVKTDLDALRDELLQVLAEVEMTGSQGGLTAAEMTELMAGVKMLVAATGGGGGGTASPAPATPQATPAASSGTKPRPKPKSTEPNPFVYP